MRTWAGLDDGGKVVDQPAVVNHITGTADAELINGTAFAGAIDGVGGFGTIYGNGGDDTIQAGVDGGCLDGGEGNDAIYGHASDDNRKYLENDLSGEMTCPAKKATTRFTAPSATTFTAETATM